MKKAGNDEKPRKSALKKGLLKVKTQPPITDSIEDAPTSLPGELLSQPPPLESNFTEKSKAEVEDPPD